MAQPLVLISYSHKDEAEKDALLDHLGVLRQHGLINPWSDDRIQGGSDWEQEIRKALAQARVAILLISVNFLTSDFILNKEVPRLLERRESEGVTVIPVIAKACAWKRVDWLAKMNVRPQNGEPIWGGESGRVDRMLAAIAEEVAEIVEKETKVSVVANPFIIGHPVPPTFFIGREDIINRCRSSLAGPARGSIALSGGRGLGKTSLLHYLPHVARAQQWDPANIFVYLYCPDIEQFSPSRFYRSLLEEIEQQEDNVALLKRVQELLEQPADISYSDFRRFLRWLKQQQRWLVVLLDGFAWVIKTDTADQKIKGDFSSHLRSLTNDPNYPLILVISSQASLNNLCEDIVRDRPESEFYNNFIFHTLTPFTPEETESLLAQAQKQIKFTFDQAERNLLHHMAGAHPALLQIAGYLLVEEHRLATVDNQPYTFTGQRYKQIVDRFMREVHNYFEQFWADSSLLERTLIILLILVDLSKQTTLPLGLTAQEMEYLLRIYERNISNLVDRGLVKERDGGYQIFSDIFAWWLVREITAESKTKLVNYFETTGQELLQRVCKTFEILAPQLTMDLLTQKLTVRDPKPHELFSTSSYKIQAELGRGASGIVYKAHDPQLDRMVAIKVLQNHPAIPAAESAKRLLKEAKAASKLNHPNIVTIYHVVEEGENVSLVMEYLEGQSLAGLLQEKGRLLPEQIMDLLDQAALALDYAHAHDVIHRDIKPANLMITNGGVLKLTDFGIAKVIGGVATTQSGEIKGTVRYMSPEQAGEQPLDNRSDLFSLATVAFEMFCGDSPWSATTWLDLMKQITGSSPRSLANYDIPAAAALDSVFQKALDKNPNKRYQSVREFVQALRSAIGSL